MVRDRGHVHAEAPGNRSVGLALIDAGLDEACEIGRREAVTSLVLGNLRVRICPNVTNDDWNVRQTGSSCRPQSLVAEVNTVATFVIARMHDDGLQDAVLADVFSQLVELCVGEFGPRVVSIFV